MLAIDRYLPDMRALQWLPCRHALLAMLAKEGSVRCRA